MLGGEVLIFLGECHPPSSGQNVSYLILYPEDGEACPSKMATEKDGSLHFRNNRQNTIWYT